MTKETRESFPDRLLHDIYMGFYGPGAWLKLVDLEERYGVSRPTVRRGLEELSAKNIIQHLPNRGYRVLQNNVEQRLEIREIRTVLECHAMQAIAERVTDADLADLERLARAFERSATEGRRPEQSAANAAFHRRLLEIHPNRTLVEELLQLRRRSPLGQPNPWASVAQMQAASEDHFAIVVALRDRNLPRLHALVRHHINEITPADPEEAMRP